MAANNENTNPVHRLPLADAAERMYHVFVRDLVVPCTIGIHEHEKASPQRVRLNIDLSVRELDQALDDDYENVVCYEKIANGVRELINRGHVNLVETLAEDVAVLCLKNIRVRSARIRVEKLDILADAASVGVEIERFNTNNQ